VPFWHFFRKGWDGRALLVLFVLGADEYLERMEGKMKVLILL
jgi:hypothetical protein